MSSNNPPKDDRTRVHSRESTRIHGKDHGNSSRKNSETPNDNDTKIQDRKPQEKAGHSKEEITRVSNQPLLKSRYQSQRTSPTANEEITNYVRNKPPSATDFASKVKIGSVLKKRFQLVSLIGKGGMGLVFKAKDLRQEEAGDLDPYVALKVLSPQLQNKKKFLIAMQQETKKTQKLAHPNIVKVYDFDRDGSVAFMTMELLKGTPLDILIKEHQLAVGFKEKKEIIRALVDGMNHAHDIGIVHADLKPNNIFIEQDGTVKIFDFGIAQAFEKDGQKKVSNRHFDVSELEAVTPRYASVRALEGHPISPQDDYYSLGCVIYMILAGEHPYGRKDALQVRKEGVKPKPINDLTGDQWEALRSLIDVNKPPQNDLAALMRAFFPETRPAHRFNKIAMGVSALLAVVLIYLSIGWIQQNRVLSDLEDHLNISADQSLEPLFYRLDNLEPKYYSSALQTIKPGLISLVEERLREQGDYESEYFNLKEAKASLEKLQYYYPDSARISALFTPLKSNEHQAEVFLKGAIEAQLESRQFLKDADWNLIKSVKAYQKTNAGDTDVTYQRVLEAYISFVQERMFFKDIATAQQALSLAKHLDAKNEQLNTLVKQLSSIDLMKVAQEQEFKAATYQLNQQRLSEFDEKSGSITVARSALENKKVAEIERLDRFLKQLQESNPLEYQAFKMHVIDWLEDKIALRSSSKESKEYLNLAREYFPEEYPSPKKVKRQYDPCQSSFANHGQSSTYRCRDSLGSRLKGPTLVVVKGNSRIKTFGITSQEISNLEFRSFCLATKRCQTLPAQNRLPIAGVSSQLAREYTAWLSSSTGKKYRLPTWDEWRIVAEQSEKAINDHNCLIQQGDKVIRGGEPRSVESGYQNSLGLQNVIGNVAEYVERGGVTLVAGGSFATPMTNCSASLLQKPTEEGAALVGIRLVRELKN